MSIDTQIDDVLGKVMKHATSAAVQKRISWRVRDFENVSDLEKFLGDGKSITQAQVFVFDGKVNLLYAMMQ